MIIYANVYTLVVIFHLQITKSQSEINCMHKRTKIKQMVTRSMPWKTVSTKWRAKGKGAGEVCSSLKKQLTFGDATTGSPVKWCLRNKGRNSILMTHHYSDLGSASDWLCCVRNLIQLIRSTTQIWVVTRHQYEVSALLSQTSFGWETSGSIAKCQLFSQARSAPEKEARFL